MTLIERRRTLMAGNRSAIDWESIARGMVDRTTEFTIPDSVEVMPNNYLFYQRTGLQGLTLSSSATTISMNMFYGCTKLASITIPSSVTSIGQTSFSGTGLTSITIPSSVTSIGVQAFTSCSSLTEVIVESATPPSLGANAFLSSNHLAAIYVPDASVATYKATSGWSTYADKIKGISERPT